MPAVANLNDMQTNHLFHKPVLEESESDLAPTSSTGQLSIIDIKARVLPGTTWSQLCEQKVCNSSFLIPWTNLWPCLSNAIPNKS